MAEPSRTGHTIEITVNGEARRCSVAPRQHLVDQVLEDLIADIPEGEKISFYSNGEFTDLCAGTHVRYTKQIKAFKLLSIAGAYDLDQFRTLLRTGRPPSGRDLGLMARVARQDFSHLNDAEIAQLYQYLRARAERVQDPPVEAQN